MKTSGSLPIAILALTVAATSLRAQTAQSAEPIEVAKLPYMEIFSPTFFWNNEADFVRMGSTTCPKGRAITGGVSIQQGKASLRMLESYPDGESWVMRVVNRQKPEGVQSLQVRGFALCLLPAARKASVLMSQQTRLFHASTKFTLPMQLFIGSIQAGLVGYHFMHLKQGDKVVILTALSSLFWMGILFVLFMGDYMTRHLIVD